MKKILSIIVIITALLTVVSCGNSPTGNNNGSQQSTPPTRKKVGLVLGGGGAKGNATLGALKVIEQSGVKIDFVAGTSIGAIIGAMYSAGYSADEIEDLFASLKWKDLLQGDQMEQKFNELLTAKGVDNFTDLKIPFRCVAVNVNTSRDEVFGSGTVYKAIRASMSIPPVYKPVELNGEKYVDGGLLNNLPVDVVKKMGAEVVIAIDLQQSKEETDFQYVSDMLNGLNNSDAIGYFVGNVLGKEYEFAFYYFKNRPDTIKYIPNKQSADIYINPALPNFNAASFGANNCRLMFSRGEDEARKYSADLAKLK